MRQCVAAGCFFFLASLLLVGCGTEPDFSVAILPDDLPSASPDISNEYLLEIDSERVELTRQYIAIHNPVLAEKLPEGDDAEAITFEPKMVVVHYTVIPTLEETMNFFQRKQIHGDSEIITKNGLLNIGIQFVVDRDGTIYRSYPDNVISRHVIGLNQVAIGIENVGTGDLGDEGVEAPLTEVQLQVNVQLIRHLANKYPSIRYMIGHEEYTDVENPVHPAHHLFYERFPEYRTEKSDPGDRFLGELRRLLPGG